MIEFFKRIGDKIDKFLAEQEKKKAICSKCAWCEQPHWMSDGKCIHPSRVEKKKDYVSGRVTTKSYTCWSYNDSGQCGKFKQKEEE
jgi:hypothetical protein